MTEPTEDEVYEQEMRWHEDRHHAQQGLEMALHVFGPAELIARLGRLIEPPPQPKTDGEEPF